jgi:hypothetical protein
MSISAVNPLNSINQTTNIDNAMVVSVDVGTLDALPSMDNMLEDIGAEFANTIHEIRNSQSMLTALAHSDNITLPQNMLKVQYLVQDYDNSLVIASSVVKQAIKAVDTLVHIQ